MRAIRRTGWLALGPVATIPIILASTGLSSDGRARAETTPPPEAPVRYASACDAAPDDPVRITLTDTIKGPVVTLERREADGRVGSEQSRDANLAHKSRRFFFKVKDGGVLIEFQGRATVGRLEGLLSDDHGARTVSLPVEPPGGLPPCPRRPDASSLPKAMKP